jgi:hypothetical protein
MNLRNNLLTSSAFDTLVILCFLHSVSTGGAINLKHYCQTSDHAHTFAIQQNASEHTRVLASSTGALHAFLWHHKAKLT